MLQQKKVFKPASSLSHKPPLKLCFWFSLEFSRKGFQSQLAKTHGLAWHGHISDTNFTCRGSLTHHTEVPSARPAPSSPECSWSRVRAVELAPEVAPGQGLPCFQPSPCEDRPLAKEVSRNSWRRSLFLYKQRLKEERHLKARIWRGLGCRFVFNKQ